MNKKTYVFALDGVLRSYDTRLGRPCPIFQKLLLNLHAQYTIYVVSSHKEQEREEIETWMDKWHIPCDKLYLEYNEYDGSHHSYKINLLEKILSMGHEIEGFFDADKTMVEVARLMGVSAVCIESF